MSKKKTKTEETQGVEVKPTTETYIDHLVSLTESLKQEAIPELVEKIMVKHMLTLDIKHNLQFMRVVPKEEANETK